jgi:hypothetical protein
MIDEREEIRLLREELAKAIGERDRAIQLVKDTLATHKRNFWGAVSATLDIVRTVQPMVDTHRRSVLSRNKQRDKATQYWLGSPKRQRDRQIRELLKRLTPQELQPRFGLSVRRIQQIGQGGKKKNRA